MKRIRTVAMIALTIVVLGGAFALPLHASTAEVVASGGSEHKIKIYVPRKELILDSSGLGETDSLDRNYINAFDLWKTYSGPAGVPDGTPITYHIEVYKREVYDGGQYVGSVDVAITDSYNQAQWRQDYSVHYINNSVIPTGIAWRIRGAVDPFVTVYEEVSADGSRWHYEYRYEYQITLEAGKASTYTVYFYNPKVEWLTFDQLRGDQSILEDYYINVNDFYERVLDDWQTAPKDFGGAVEDIFNLTGEYLPVTVAVLGLVGVALIFKGAKN